jgi:hypothetical protein
MADGAVRGWQYPDRSGAPLGTVVSCISSGQARRSARLLTRRLSAARDHGQELRCVSVIRPKMLTPGHQGHCRVYGCGDTTKPPTC